MNLVDQIFTGVIVLIGEEGVDWEHYLDWPPYWLAWAELNRN